MSRQDDRLLGRMDGLQMALRIVNEDGIEGLRREIAFRGRTKINTNFAMKEIENALRDIKALTIETVMIMSIMVLHDEFDFGPARIKRFTDRYLLKTDCLADALVSWMDMTDWIQDYLGINMDLRNMEREGWAKQWQRKEDSNAS